MVEVESLRWPSSFFPEKKLPVNLLQGQILSSLISILLRFVEFKS